MISIAFTGDIAFSGYFKDKYDGDILGESVKEFLTSADHVAANVEGAVTDLTDGREFHHSSPEASVSFLKSIGADIWNLGNNHTFDLGVGGVKSTLSCAEKCGFRTIGATDPTEPVIIGDNEVALISVTYEERNIDDGGAYYGTLNWTDARLEKMITEAKKKCRYCIVVAHCGDEFSPLPLPYVRRRYHKYLEYGADAVVGHHPHVVQNYETVGDKVIFYSLGNFVFDTNYQRAQNHTDLGVLLRLDLGDTLTWDHLPIKIDRAAGRVVKTDDIPVFCDLGEKEYGKYWPLAAKMLEKNQIKAKIYLHGARGIKAKMKDAARRIVHLKYDFGRDLFFGSVRSGFVRCDKDSSLYKYIIGS